VLGEILDLVPDVVELSFLAVDLGHLGLGGDGALQTFLCVGHLPDLQIAYQVSGTDTFPDCPTTIVACPVTKRSGERLRELASG
jgi:hypothetical protein